MFETIQHFVCLYSWDDQQDDDDKVGKALPQFCTKQIVVSSSSDHLEPAGLVGKSAEELLRHRCCLLLRRNANSECAVGLPDGFACAVFKFELHPPSAVDSIVTHAEDSLHPQLLTAF
eukprot:3068409-Rhodomonas_salina.1